MLRYFLASGAEAVARPSGTEPKLKIYLSAAGASSGESEACIDALAEAFEQRLRGLV